MSSKAENFRYHLGDKLLIRLINRVYITRRFGQERMNIGPVVQRLDNAIHRINHYPVNSMVCFVNTYPLDSDLSGG